MKRNVKLSKFPWKALMSLGSSILTGGWAADGIKGDPLFTWIPILCNYPIIITSVVTILFISSIAWAYSRRSDFLAFRTLNQEECSPHSCLILPLSIMLPKPVTSDFPIQFASGVSIPGDDLQTDIEGLNPAKWNWQQMLRVLQIHQHTLKHVFLIGSADTEYQGKKTLGSFHDITFAKKIIKKYCPNIVKIDDIDHYGTPVDFEDFKSLVSVMEEGISFYKKKGLHEQDIIIDATGGQKITSIAAAVVTMNNNVTFHYVQTNPPNRVLAYDLLIQSEQK